MALINVADVKVHNNPAKPGDLFKFEITFEARTELNDDLDWKMIYVGSAESDSYDQVLDDIAIGPIPQGRHRFFFESEKGPNLDLVPPSELVGVTVVLLAASYRSQEFITIGYYVSNEYTDPELIANPPETPQIDKLRRRIIDDQPRITRKNIKWLAKDANKKSEGEEVSGMSDGQTEEATASSAQTNGSVSDDSCDIVEDDSEAKEMKESRDTFPLNDISNNGGTEDKDATSTKAIDNEQNGNEIDNSKDDEEPTAKRARQDDSGAAVAMS